jgi:hypothetical protein
MNSDIILYTTLAPEVRYIFSLSLIFQTISEWNEGSRFFKAEDSSRFCVEPALSLRRVQNDSETLPRSE